MTEKEKVTEKKEKKKDDSGQINMVTAVGVLLIVAISVFAIMLVTQTQDNEYEVAVADENKVISNSLKYINANLLGPNTTAEVLAINDLGSIYQLEVKLQNEKGEINELISYVSKDGKYFFTSGYELE